ncbi:MAG: hypothetical protein SFT92_07730 [Rickettsiales bacterium]|nr:hypothetical protein [Rickettsiales bacterium]
MTDERKLNLLDRRGTPDDLPVSEYFHGKKRFYNSAYNIHIVKIFAGEWAISNREDEMLATILGSCVSACIRDPLVGVGGMNHFLLPGDENSDATASDAARYGVNAMESLINALLKAGAQKHRLEFKIFGGGNVINNSARIGSKNARFVRSFLKEEGYRIVSEDLEGEQPRSLHYYPVTGKVMLRKLKRKEDFVVVEEEAKYQQQISKKPQEGEIELF